MTKKEELLKRCVKRLQSLGHVNDGRYRDRLKYELIEIDVQEKYEYFLGHFHKKTHWAKNDHNLLVPYLLGLCPDFDIEQEPGSVMGEYPDIDMDFLVCVRDYLRNEWAPKEFGKDNVAHIGTYQTYVLKQALIDMARVFGLDRDEIQVITKQFATKDNEGDLLTWEKAQELYPAFKKWCQKYPEAADAAHKLQGRIRNMSQHAGGFIISSKPLKGFAPLVRNKKDDSLMTAWPEGQTSQDLMQVGLVKFDLLASEMQEQIVDCIGLVLERHGLEGICTVPGGPTWSDDSYLDDMKAIKMADRSDLRFIFQFDSDGIRRLVKSGGVDRFQDLEAYSALYRPGPLNNKVHDVYCRRKKGLEEYEIHPVLQKYLAKTYGVMCIHEDTLISLADGRQMPIKRVRRGDMVHSVNLVDKVVGHKECHGCGPTRVSDGLKMTLSNGYSVVLTSDHKVLTYEGMKPVGQLDENDLIAAPAILPHCSNTDLPDISWLGDWRDAAYLFGQLVGDGNFGTGSTLCTGTKRNHDIVVRWIKGRFPKLFLHEYFHCRSWYVGISCSDLLNRDGYGNRKTKWHKLLEDMCLKKSCKEKFVPDAILSATDDIRAAFLSGLVDSDGCLFVSGKRNQICFFTSASERLLHGIRQLLAGFGIVSAQRKNRIYVNDTEKFSDVVGEFLVVKKFEGRLTNGGHSSFVPKWAIREKCQFSGVSQRQFCKEHKVSRGVMRTVRNLVTHNVANRCGVDCGDLRYYPVKRLEVVKDQRFYGMSVADYHNLVANGIVVSNCYQEQIMQILHAVGKVPLRDAYDVVKAISKKKIEKFAKYKETFIGNAQVVLGISQEEALKFWKQIEEFANYGFNKAHSCAYTHQSSRQLWLKAHFPLEFYCTMLNHVRGDVKRSLHEKIRDCKRNSELHGVKVNPVNINRSCMNFCIPDGEDEVYFGFSNIKFVGEDAGSRIVDLREEDGDFESFRDFLDRFGTDARVVQSLVALGAFDDADPLTLWRYYGFYKNHAKKRQERIKRFSTAMGRYQEQYDELVDDGQVVHEESIDAALEHIDKDSEAAKKLRRLRGNYRRSVTRFQENSVVDQNIKSLSEFAESPVESSIKEEVYETLIDKEKAEMQFYGFCWRNPLDVCEDAEGYTFEQARDLPQNREAGYPVEGLIHEVKDKTSAKGNKFRVLKLVDANWEMALVYVWAEEKERFKDEFKEGNIVRLRILPPWYKFNHFQLLSFPAYLGRKVPPPESDFRVVVLYREEAELPTELVTVEEDESPVTLNIMKQSGFRSDDVRQQADELYREVSEYFN